MIKQKSIILSIFFSDLTFKLCLSVVQKQIKRWVGWESLNLVTAVTAWSTCLKEKPRNKETGGSWPHYVLLRGLDIYYAWQSFDVMYTQSFVMEQGKIKYMCICMIREWQKCCGFSMLLYLISGTVLCI